MSAVFQTTRIKSAVFLEFKAVGARSLFVREFNKLAARGGWTQKQR